MLVCQPSEGHGWVKSSHLMPNSFQYTALDDVTRRLMLEEIQQAKANGEVYFSTRFTPAGHAAWPDLLADAARTHDEHWLAYELEAGGLIEAYEPRRLQRGGYTLAHVSDRAPETQADGQFTRFYIAAICRRALDEGRKDVTVYRAKQRATTRSESNALEGQKIDAASLLAQVRTIKGSFACGLLKPNSGLAVE